MLLVRTTSSSHKEDHCHLYCSQETRRYVGAGVTYVIIGLPHTTEITQKHDVHIDNTLPNTVYIKKFVPE